jgi:hypothetical protein
VFSRVLVLLLVKVVSFMILPPVLRANG